MADRCQQRGPLLVDDRQRARLLCLAAQHLALIGGPGGVGEGVEHALILGKQRRAAAEQPQPRADRNVEAKRRLLAGRRPAHVLDVAPFVGATAVAP